MTELGLGEIATVSGRYYAMDRDNRFDRVQKAYDAIVNRKAELFDTAKLALDTAYDRDETDEFVVPCCIKQDALKIICTKAISAMATA